MKIKYYACFVVHLETSEKFYKRLFCINKVYNSAHPSYFLSFPYYILHSGDFKEAIEISDTLRANVVVQKSILNKLVCVHRMMRTSKAM